MERAGHDRTLANSALGYGVALFLPLLVMLAVARFQLPTNVFEQVIALLVVGVALRWDRGPAIVVAVVAVLADNVLLRELVGEPTVTGARDALDLVFFLSVAVAVGWLVARARRDRLRATEAARLERDAREQRERLIATVSHDLATPLAAIRGTVQFAQRFGADAPLDLDRLLVRLNTAATRASWLVQTLSDAKSLEDGGLSLTLSEVDMRELVAPVVHMLDRMSERHPLILAVPPHPVPVRCDSGRLQRVVENLLTNAIKYSPDGGAIEVTLAQDGRDAVLTVRDHGIGISRDAAPHLFDRHYRAPEASNAASGLGLGLHIAAEIVRRHEGTIQAGPALPNGSVFTVRIPLARMEVAGLAPGASERRAHV